MIRVAIAALPNWHLIAGDPHAQDSRYCSRLVNPRTEGTSCAVILPGLDFDQVDASGPRHVFCGGVVLCLGVDNKTVMCRNAADQGHAEAQKVFGEER